MIGLLVSCILLLILLGVVGLSTYVGWQLTHPKRKIVDDTPENYNLHRKDVTFPSRTDGVLLDGWYLESPNAASLPKTTTVIMSHGYAGTRLEKGLPALSLAQALVNAGYHVLMFDFRNSGRSAGNTTTIGFLEKEDILGAIEWVQTYTSKPTEIILLGFSMGGTSSILAAAEAKDVAGVITDSAFSQLLPYLKENLPVWSKLPRYPFTPLILFILPKLIGVNPHAVDALAAVDQIVPRPILFIHSKDDQAIPYTNSAQMYKRHPAAFELWITEKAGHVGSFQLESEAYIKRVLNFIAKC
ncbi:alpha/beta hydrolase [Paenibacillus sp. Soil750]|uniref:alpha/beta hydrolase n=1 Tax=Paenibacillus sp. Soil750 TaxID=1736398 RepID=UPI0006F723BE|nr:alpha/beta fold hydrolase [Paenibacillus sp. Soil750]KRE72436.1 alpha/beta hydrolase [Paenibacillus sp. Soil750]